jgi:glycine/D-amino acid oxidase-like deaminating enzyme/nitrite reductase/ring-hydroxylating ferredoxin subunit
MSTREGTSYWLKSVRINDRLPLKRNLAVDVCIVGAGIAGMTTAYLLARAGRSVAVLEDGSIGHGMTGYTTAHLTAALDDRYCELERYHGDDGIRMAASSHSQAIECIERIVAAEQLECDFMRVDGYLFAPPGDTTQDLEKEFAAIHRAGLTGVARVSKAPIEGFDTGPALRFPNQAQFHPLKYLEGLALALERLGGKIFCHTHAASIEGGDDARVEADNGAVVKTGAIVVATNVPINDRLVIHTKQAPYTTYVIGAEIPAGAAVPALYWDTRQSADESSSGDAPYHYVRLARDARTSGAREFLIVGGEDHKSGQDDDDAGEHFVRLENWARERWPAMEQVAFRWSGQVMEPADGMAFIGRNPLDKSNVYVATGDSGNGMTHGTIAGMLLTDLIQGRTNAWESLYDPGRVIVKTAPDFIKENVNVAGQYVKGYLGGGAVSDVDDIPPGEGAVIRHGAKKIAVFRDENGGVHEHSAVCPHLGCIVAWNSAEKTWDCPCHGSRFDKSGKVINGPANKDLEALESADADK